MSNEALDLMLKLYDSELTDRFRARPNQFEDRNGLVGHSRTIKQLDHALFMVKQMSLHMGMWPDEKMQRWLGFVQGVLWMAGAYTIDELRCHVAASKEV